MSRVIGLTGGIATGKSTVSNYLRSKGLPIVDADSIAKEVVTPGNRGLSRIVDIFGPQILNESGQLDRTYLGKIVFNSDHQMRRLNDALQPLIRQQILRTINQLTKTNQLVILDIPLLFEQGYENVCDQIIVVSVNPQTQLQRLMRRNHLSEKEARARIQSQIPLKIKRHKANVVIDNNGSLKRTYEQIDKWLLTVSND